MNPPVKNEQINQFIINAIPRNDGSVFESIFDACDNFGLTYEAVSRVLSPFIVSRVQEEAISKDLLKDIPRLPFE